MLGQEVFIRSEYVVHPGCLLGLIGQSEEALIVGQDRVGDRTTERNEPLDMEVPVQRLDDQFRMNRLRRIVAEHGRQVRERHALAHLRRQLVVDAPRPLRCRRRVLVAMRSDVVQRQEPAVLRQEPANLTKEARSINETWCAPA